MIEHLISSIENKDFEKAIDECDLLIAKNPLNPILYQIRATCNFGLGRKTESVIDLDIALQKSIGVNEEQIPEILQKRGNILYSDNKFSEAAEDFKKKCDLLPNDYVARYSLAQTLKQLGLYDDALNYTEEAINLNPANTDILNLKGNLLYSKGDIQSSISSYTKAIELDNTNPKPFYNRGIILYNTGEKEKAKADLKKAVSLDNSLFKELSDIIPDFNSFITEDSNNEVQKVQDTIPKEENIKESVIEDVSAKDDIVIPQFDFDKIFRENAGTEDISAAEISEESNLNKTIIDNNIQDLHQDITVPVIEKTYTPPNFEPVKTERQYFPEEKNEKSSFNKIVFYIILFLIIGVGLLYGLNYLLTNLNKPSEQQIASTDTTKKQISDNSSDSVVPENKNTAVKENKEEIKTPPAETLGYQGFISDKKNFALFLESDGYFVQLGSFKDKNAAAVKLNYFKNLGLPVNIYETDLKEKGIYYRIRAGVYKTKEEAINNLLKFE